MKPLFTVSARTFVDRGGTFTDVVTAHADGRVTVRKVPSHTAVVGDLCEGSLTFGTTVATNALLERKVAPALLLVDVGFGDLVRIGDMTRPELFNPDASWPEPLCARVCEVPEGGLADFNIDTQGIASVAVASCFDSQRELAVLPYLPPALPVSLGHALCPTLGYLTRIETTLLDAAITPVLHAAMAADRIPESAVAIRSDGSLCAAADLRAPDAILSGPAGGVLAVAEVVRLAGVPGAAGLDMGGTSTDVCLIKAGELRRRLGEWKVGGLRLSRPALEVETIAAGGGSILAYDGLRYTVGPHSAGSRPGPQVFGLGGPPTLTDASVKAGLIDVDTFDTMLNVSAIDLPGPADAFIEIARESMAAAVRRLALSRGQSLKDWALVAFGGAAGQHACAVAERLGVTTVLVHAFASVMSAWGQSLAVHAEETTIPLRGRVFDVWSAVEAGWREAAARLPNAGTDSCSVALQYVGTDTPIEVEVGTSAGAIEAHAAEHYRQFGFDRPELPVEVVWVRVRRVSCVNNQRVEGELPVELAACTAGPARLRLFGTTVIVPVGWTARRQGAILHITRDEQSGDPLGAFGTRHGEGLDLPDVVRPVSPKADHDRPLELALWGARFSGVAAEAGEVLRRLARSVSIRERLDFSCAIFDHKGTLIANAPHVPVHLGAMGETVRDVIRHAAPTRPGDAWLTNDPQAGGSHLPDLTVVSCVALRGGTAFVASRAHHVDVGGLTSGSMPPHSRTLADEGLVLRRWPLVVEGKLCLPPLTESRAPETVAADLVAQLAANRHAAVALADLGPAAEIAHWMAELVSAVEAATDQVMAGLSGNAADSIDGVPLHLSVANGRFDWTGTGGPHSGNLNAPPGVLRAAILYAVRVLSGRDLPLNEGVLRRVALIVPQCSIIDPPLGAAVVGGNVETSQRLVDLVFAAVGARAASAGTMNNLTLGGDGWAFYETIGGGLGAREGMNGRSGGQLHMTNTRATDPEVLAARLPLRVRQFAFRTGSGGDGRWRGGDGLIREIEVLETATATLLAAWRADGAPGFAGGGAGKPGRAQLFRNKEWLPWDGASTTLAAGDRVRVFTPGGGGWGER